MVETRDDSLFTEHMNQWKGHPLYGHSVQEDLILSSSLLQLSRALGNRQATCRKQIAEAVLSPKRFSLTNPPTQSPPALYPESAGRVRRCAFESRLPDAGRAARSWQVAAARLGQKSDDSYTA